MKRILLLTLLVFLPVSAFAQQSVAITGMKAEDGTAANGDKGFPVLIKRCDSAASTASADGKYGVLCADSSGNLRVVISNALASDATAGSAASATGPQMMGDCDDTATVAGVENAAARVRVDCSSRAIYARQLDPCSAYAKTYYVVNISTATTVEIANAVSSQFFYVCSVDLVAAAAQTIAIGEDDTDNCGSITAGLSGGATAATGWSFAANGGIVLGTGAATVLKTATAARYFCIITGQAAQISGTISYVLAP